jgi:hypothetical protein
VFDQFWTAPNDDPPGDDDWAFEALRWDINAVFADQGDEPNAMDAKTLLDAIVRQAIRMIGQLNYPAHIPFVLTEQGEGDRQVPCTIKLSSGQLWLNFEGYGECSTVDGLGDPVGVELYDGTLRVMMWPDINAEDPQVMDMEGANERARKFRICQKDSKVGEEVLYWKNDMGWVSWQDATLFTREERKTLNLPIGGEWE